MWNDLMTMKKLSSYKRAEIGWAMWSIGLYNNTWLEEKTFQYQHFGKVIIARSKIIISIPDLECILFNFTQSRYDRNMVIHSMLSSQRQGFVVTELHFVWSSVLNHKALTLWRWFHICLISLLIPFHSESDKSNRKHSDTINDEQIMQYVNKLHMYVHPYNVRYNKMKWNEIQKS